MKIIVSEPWTATSQPAIEWDEQTKPWQCWLPHLVMGHRGELILQHYIWADTYFPPMPPEPCVMLRSEDKGRTWTSLGEFRGCSSLGGMLRDGTMIHLSFLGQEKEPGLWMMRVRRSLDGGKTWHLEENVPVHIPGAQRELGQNLNQGVYPDGNLIEMEDGSRLASGYGHFPNELKYRAYLIRSTDRGKSWQYFSTIAYAPDIGSEGFCEPSIARLRNGRLIAVMRVGSREPMYQCYSLDGGRTWTKPECINARSVEPDLLLMSNGVLVCSYGRPGAWIMFSADGTGERWTDHTEIDPCPSWDYTSIVEIEPGVLLYAYDHQGMTDPSSGKKVNAIRLRTVRVER